MSESLDGYELVALLGRGATATVWQAVPLGGGAPVAVKRLRRPADAVVLADEARMLAALDHPHLLRVLDCRPDGDGVALVLELADGGSLAARLAAGTLPTAEVAALGRALAGALGAVHAAGLVHGDVRAANVLRVGERWCLADLGLARPSAPADGRPADGARADVDALITLLIEAVGPADHGPAVASLVAMLASAPRDAVAFAAACAAFVDELPTVDAALDPPRPTTEHASPVRRAPHPVDLEGPTTTDVGRPPPDADGSGRGPARRRSRPIRRTPSGAPPRAPRRVALAAAWPAVARAGSSAASGAAGLGARAWARRPRSRVAALAMAIGGAVLVLAFVGRGDGSGPRCPDGAPSGAVLTGDFDGDGCRTPVVWDAGVASLDPRGLPAADHPVGAGTAVRYGLGGPDDRLVIGDWDCDGQDTLGVHHPDGTTTLYDGWPAAGVEVAGRTGDPGLSCATGT